jgi:hypothetical protein
LTPFRLQFEFFLISKKSGEMKAPNTELFKEGITGRPHDRAKSGIRSGTESAVGPTSVRSSAAGNPPTGGLEWEQKPHTDQDGRDQAKQDVFAEAGDDALHVHAHVEQDDEVEVPLHIAHPFLSLKCAAGNWYSGHFEFELPPLCYRIDIISMPTD